MAGREHTDREARAADPAAVWSGLSGLSDAQRQQLVRGIVPRVTDHLERCLESVAQDWSAGGDEADSAEWANQLQGYQYVLRRQFEEALERDFVSTTYPPEYEFSGSSYADDNSGLQILDDYQSTRRSLRHKLEGLVREQNRYSWFVFLQAAREDHRFEHPGWAPWSPLNWYERGGGGGGGGGSWARRPHRLWPLWSRQSRAAGWSESRCPRSRRATCPERRRVRAGPMPPGKGAPPRRRNRLPRRAPHLRLAEQGALRSLVP